LYVCTISSANSKLKNGVADQSRQSWNVASHIRFQWSKIQVRPLTIILPPPSPVVLVIKLHWLSTCWCRAHLPKPFRPVCHHCYTDLLCRLSTVSLAFSFHLTVHFPKQHVCQQSVIHGRNHGWKVEWNQGLGSNTGARLKVGCWVREGVAPSRCEGPEVSPRKIFENSDAKSCILVTTCCEISCFLKTKAKKLGDQYIVGPQPKSWGTSLPRSLRLLRLCCRLAFYTYDQKVSASYR